MAKSKTPPRGRKASNKPPGLTKAGRPRKPGAGSGSNAPTKFKPEFVAQARKLAELGLSDAEIASFFEVHVRNFHRWKISHPEFAAALEPGKAVANQNVEKSLYRQAMGYSHDAVKIMLNRDGKPVVVNYVEQVAPNVAAAIFWLKNREPEKWRDRREWIDPSAEGVTIKGGLPEDAPAATEPAEQPAEAPADKPPNADG